MKNKKINNLLILSALLLPSIVIAKSSDSEINILSAIFMEAFISIHMSLFVLLPLSKIFFKSNSKKAFWTMFFIRIGILLLFDFFITTSIVVVDFIMVFVGAFIVIPISVKLSGNKTSTIESFVSSISISNQTSQPLTIKCKKCNLDMPVTNKFCTNCGSELKDYLTTEKILTPFSFNPIYRNDEEKLLEEFINIELQKVNFDKNTQFLPSDILRKKTIMNIILSILIFVYVSLIFFHFPILTYIIGLIIILIFSHYQNKYNYMTYLKKEIKSRPSEKISNIIMNIKETSKKDNRKITRTALIILAIFLPLLIFINPRIMYEKTNDDYAVRFYTFGLTNFKTAEIPDKYKGKPVVSLRGNTFSNMPFLKEVTLPDTIKEIRGQAFKNDINLTKVNIPTKLEYLGGGAFYNCKSITEIELPDTLTYLGGESFYNASSLKKVKLSKNISEIRGNTFEECESLENINIPDKVERIGGHAFYNNASLKKVTLTEDSRLKEIGSSAFRLCPKLSSIKIPKGTTVNERAFKESPTKIKYFGDIDYDQLVDDTKYNNKKFIYLSNIGKVEYISYPSNAISYGASITLLKVEYEYNSYKYTLKYTDSLGELTFIIDKFAPYQILNENFAVSIGSEYALNTYTSGFSLNVYYN